MTQFLRLLVFVVIVGSIAACGRAGPLEPPSTTVVNDENAEQTPEEDKPFILDGILN